MKHSVMTPAQEEFNRLYANHIQDPGRFKRRTVLGLSAHRPKLDTTIATVGSRENQFSQVARQQATDKAEKR